MAMEVPKQLAALAGLLLHVGLAESAAGNGTGSELWLEASPHTARNRYSPV